MNIIKYKKLMVGIKNLKEEDYIHFDYGSGYDSFYQKLLGYSKKYFKCESVYGSHIKSICDYLEIQNTYPSDVMGYNKLVDYLENYKVTNILEIE